MPREKITVYVDDIKLTGNWRGWNWVVKEDTCTGVWKKLEDLRYFLAIQVSIKGSLSQRKYVWNPLKDVGMLRCKLGDAPIDVKDKIGASTEHTAVNKLVGNSIGTY